MRYYAEAIAQGRSRCAGALRRTEVATIAVLCGVPWLILRWPRPSVSAVLWMYFADV